MDTIKKLIEKENRRQLDGIELIASENFVSKNVLEAAGSILTNKYAEGYPGKRYYGGCEFVDEIEIIAQERLKKLFNAKFVNVQPHSGSQANMAVFFALLKPGDKILAMNLNHGGHLTHGSKMNFSGMLYDIHSYGVSQETETLDYLEIQKQAEIVKPKLIIAGGSAYSRKIDFKKFKEIANSVNAKLMVDMAHIAGLIAAGLHENPLMYADVVTSTTHKTLRGPRGGIILTNDEEIYKAVNKSLFPGMQGGPLMHIIAAKAVCFGEALEDSFKKYQQQVIKNARILSEELKSQGIRIVSGGTETHLFLLDLKSKGITGNIAQEKLYEADITVNKNMIPFDLEKPTITTGIRIGSPAVTTRGMKDLEMKTISHFILDVFNNLENEKRLKEIKLEVNKFTRKFGMYEV